MDSIYQERVVGNITLKKTIVRMGLSKMTTDVVKEKLNI